MLRYRPGTIVQVKARFYRDGEPADPERVELQVNRPHTGRPGRQWRPVAEEEITREGVGRYRADIPTKRTGVYFYRWESDLANYVTRCFTVAEPEE